MGVAKNCGTPKWMVYSGKPYEQMDDLGGNPYFWKHLYDIFTYMKGTREPGNQSIHLHDFPLFFFVFWQDPIHRYSNVYIYTHVYSFKRTLFRIYISMFRNNIIYIQSI